MGVAGVSSFVWPSVSPISNILIVVSPPDLGDPKDSRRFPVSYQAHSRCSSKLFFFSPLKRIEMGRLGGSVG